MQRAGLEPGAARLQGCSWLASEVSARRALGATDFSPSRVQALAYLVVQRGLLFNTSMSGVSAGPHRAEVKMDPPASVVEVSPTI